MLVLVGALLLALCYVAGARSTFLAHHAQTVDAEVEVMASIPPAVMVSFGDERVLVYTRDLAWTDGSRGGDGNPPCLRTEGDRLTLEAEVIELGRQGPTQSFSYWQVLSVTCPSR